MASYEGKNEEERKGKKRGSLRLRKPKDRPKLVDLPQASPSAAADAVEVPQPGRDRADSATTTTASVTTPPGEEGPGADSPNKKRHQRTRSVGKGGLMNLIGLKKNKNSNRKGATEPTQADVERNMGSDSAEPSVDDAEESEQHLQKTVSAVVTGSIADNNPHPGPGLGQGGGEGDAEENESESSSSSTVVDEHSTGVDTEEAEPSSAAPAVVGSSVSWHSSSSGGAVRRKLPSSSSSPQEQTEADDPQPSSSADDASLARPTAPRPLPDHKAISSSTKRLSRRSLSTQVKLFPPLPSAPGQTAAKEAEAAACSSPVASVLAQAAANGPASARQVPDLRSNVSAVSAMHQTRPSGRKRMTMDPSALKALYAQDPGFQRRLSTTAASLSTQRSQAQSAVGEAPEVLLALQTLAEQGIEEEHIWNGKPEVFPLLEPFKNELKKAAEVGRKSSAINFLLPDIPFFGGLKAKTFKVNNLQPIAHLLRAITAKLGGKSMTLRRSSFALTTLAGHHLDPSEVLASYGLGSILQMWELKIVVLKRGVSGVHAAVDKKPLPNPQQLIFEQVKGLQSQTANLGQRAGRAETERRQIEARMEELAREMEKNEREREEARVADEAESQQRLRREWRLDVESGIQRLRDEIEQREARLRAEANELRDTLEQERGQARAKEDRLASALAALVGEVESMRGREAQERQRVEGLVAVFREEMEERERERTQREKALREEIERAKALMKGGEEAKQAQSELDVAKVVAALQAENDRQRKELVRRAHDDWERERQALVVHLRAEWERETRAAVQRLREDWERERAKEHEALARRAREEREQSEEKQREQAERNRREVRSLVEQESGKAVREVLEEVAGKVAKLQSHLEASEKKVERQAKALELLDKRVKAAAGTPPSAPSSSAVTPPPPPPPTVVTPAAGLPIIAKPAASKRPALQREDRSCANLLLAGLQKRFAAIQQSQAEELEEAGDDASW